MKKAADLMTDAEPMIDIAAGNIGALNVAIEAMKDGRRDVLERLFDLGVTGPSLYVLFVDLGDRTLPTLYRNATAEAEVIRERLAALGY